MAKCNQLTSVAFKGLTGSSASAETASFVPHKPEQKTRRHGPHFCRWQLQQVWCGWFRKLSYW